MREWLRDNKRRRQVIGETVLWGAIVWLVGAALFGSQGAFLATVAFAFLHVAARRREAELRRPLLAAWHLVLLPGLVGIALAGLPLVSWLLFVPVLLVPWLGTPLPRRLGPARRGRIAGFAMIAATIWICAVFPKHLDRRVGPARYRDVSLRELGMELFRNHDIDCRLDVGPRPDRFDFDIPRPMTRREVLQKLADETGLRLHLRGCGTGETLLWGPHYSPRLSPKPGAPWR